MALAYVQSQSASGATSVTMAHFSGNPVAGNSITVHILIDQAIQNRVVSVTDSAGNTFNRIYSQPGTGQDLEVWQAENIASGGASHTVTVNAQSGDNIVFI